MLVGVAISVGAPRWIVSLLFGLPANDPITYGYVALLLLGVATVACLLPAAEGLWNLERGFSAGLRPPLSEMRSRRVSKSESAFTELVQRHFTLVYSVASRRLRGDAHLS